MNKKRIDELLVESAIAESVARARALIMSGVVLANDRRVEKASEEFAPGIKIRLKGNDGKSKYVGRGGLKLEKALEHFHIRPNAYVCLDVGASTGGFTDCLLQNGAKKVVALDVGTNQLVWKLRNNPLVEVRENVNARYLKPDDFDEKFDLIVVDVSFISVRKILSALVSLLKNEGKIVVLIKPQFEVKKGEVEEGGVIREPEKHCRVVSEINAFAKGCGLKVLGVVDSPILGADGNKEFLALYQN